MGTYFDPSNDSFTHDANSPIYIDKTGLIELLNARIFTADRCIAVSHARRFGKSQAAGMLKAYYSMGADSHDLFSRFEIAKSSDFGKYLNKFHVIHLDISSFAVFYENDLVSTVKKYVTDEMQIRIPDIDYSKTISKILFDAYERTGIPFVIILDEWDCVIRNLPNRPEIIHAYMQFLHDMFKSEESKSFLALGYITGILPIKKIKDESALNNFDECTMLDSGDLAPYFGFTEKEVKDLCAKYGMDLGAVKEWYDGYLINGIHMYNPNSVSKAMTKKSLAAYWKNTSAFDTINDLISMDFDGLKEDILQAVSGVAVNVDPYGFKNDLSQIEDKDDALTALIHLGYLGYDKEKGKAYLPNFEVGQAYKQALKKGSWKEIAKVISNCEKLLDATLAGDADTVAALIEEAHAAYAPAIRYNNEIALSSVVSLAYFTAQAYYTIVREMPTGKGFADLAFIPRKEAGSRPAMIIELKWDQTADTAIRQIRERRYTGTLAEYGDVLLVGISYDKKSKKHSCVIEKAGRF